MCLTLKVLAFDSLNVKSIVKVLLSYGGGGGDGEWNGKKKETPKAQPNL